MRRMRGLVAALVFAALPLTAAGATGTVEFRRRCAACHGIDGTGGERAPAARPAGRTSAQIADLIRAGIPNRGMPAFPLPEAEISALATFVQSVAGPRKTAPRLPVRPLP
ncbi:MAG: cytochrome c, partial [Acidobacteria bacterium]|nr:cytochrome c [Acidobacteriota bacterium]